MGGQSIVGPLSRDYGTLDHEGANYNRYPRPLHSMRPIFLVSNYTCTNCNMCAQNTEYVIVITQARVPHVYGRYWYSSEKKPEGHRFIKQTIC